MNHLITHQNKRNPLPNWYVYVLNLCNTVHLHPICAKITLVQPIKIEIQKDMLIM